MTEIEKLKEEIENIKRKLTFIETCLVIYAKPRDMISCPICKVERDSGYVCFRSDCYNKT